jgi:hypothetical protein
MEAVDWTALSVLAAVVLGAIGYLARDMHRQLHALEMRMDARFTQVDARFTQVDGRFDRVEQRIDALTERYVRHLEAHASH